MPRGVVRLGPDDHGEQLQVVLHFADVAGGTELVGITVSALDADGEPLAASQAQAGRSVEPLTADHVRRLPLGRLITRARTGLWADLDAIADSGGAVQRPARPTPTWTDERLQRVAEVYTAALRSGARPRLAVAEAEHISPDQASKAIRKARDAGLLGETQPGRAGGIPDHQESAGTDPAADEQEQR